MSNAAINGAQPRRWGADPATWKHFVRLTPLLLPVVSNPHSTISPNSTLTEPNKGKVPSHYDGVRQIVGIEKWQALRANGKLIKRYMILEPDYGICIVTQLVRAIDVDITDVDVSIGIRALIDKHFGQLPIRHRSNSLKFLAAITLPGEYAKRVLVIGEGRVEFLATGQQFIAAGTHKSGVPYEWQNGLPAAFPVVSPEAFEAFWGELVSLYGGADATPGRSDGAVSSEVPPSPSDCTPEEIDWYLARIDPSKLKYDVWLHVLMAVHFEMQGSQRGYNQCDAWSSRDSAGYREAHWPSKWESFHLDNPRPHTIQLLKKLAGGEDYSQEYKVVADDSSPSVSDKPETSTPIKTALRVMPLTLAMLKATPPDPEVIVEKLLLMDACGFVSPGGMGKTTLAIYEGVRIILGKPLWGRQIVKPGRVVFITAEDSERIVRTRLIQICEALHLSDAELEIVAGGFYIEDLSMTGGRLVGVAPKTGLVQPTLLVADIIAQYHDLNISLVHLDPASLLGPGEQSGNDGMAELMRAARRIAAALGAACQIVHHVAQVVARNGIQDQYAGRGGTAFADNSRGQRQLVRIKERGYEFDGKHYRMPDTVSDDDLERGRVLAILVHKLSYVELDSRPIFILRSGFGFRQFECETAAAKVEQTMAESIQAIGGFIMRELQNGRRHSTTSLEKCAGEWKLSQKKVRAAANMAVGQGIFVYQKDPKSGGQQEFLMVAEDVPDDIQTPV